MSDFMVPADKFVKQWTIERRTLWGSWTLNRKTNELGYPPAAYWIPAEQLQSATNLLDWIFQLNSKSWVTPQLMKDFLDAVEDLVHPQSSIVNGPK
jgi:hypothetical protein